MKISISLKDPIHKKPRKQSAVIPYRYIGSDLMITLIKSKHRGKWGIPKGAIESHLTVKKSAKLEALEEAGLKGKIRHKLGEYAYVKGSTGRRQRVKVFSMLVSKFKTNYLEAKWRTRKEFTADKALKKLNKVQKGLLKDLIEILRVESNNDNKR